MARSILKRKGAGTVAVVVTALVLLVGCHARKPIAEADAPEPAVGRFRVERDIAVPMRDGIVLRADVYRPETVGRLPVLVYRTPYGKHNAADSYQTHLKAVARNYVVVLQDVRGRYASDGRFIPTGRRVPTVTTRSNGPRRSPGPTEWSARMACRIRGPCNGWPRWRRRRIWRRWHRP